MFTVDAHTSLASSWLVSTKGDLVTSDWGLAEFTSALSLGVRVGRLTASERSAAESAIEAWLNVDMPALAVQPGDIRQARGLIKATTAPLRTGDALHLAVAARLGCSIATFDIHMAEAAVDFGIVVEDLSPHA
jgi:hypothetical protein